MKQTLKNILITGVIISLTGSIQWGYDQVSKEYKSKRKKALFQMNSPVIPSDDALRLLSFGHPPLIADLLWIQTIQYFGTGNPYGNYPSLGPLLVTITNLDPKFSYPYEFGLVALPFMGQTDTAIELGEKAQKEIPGNGLLTYYLASDYQLNKKDYKKAAKYYLKASKEPGAPAAAERLAGISLANVDNTLKDRLTALSFWETVYTQAKNEEEKERASKWFAHLQIVYSLENAAEAYKKQTGSYPPSLTTLIETGYIKEVPPSPIGRRLDYSPKTGKISFQYLAEE